MKLRLPIVLLSVLLSSAAITQASAPIRPLDIINVEQGNTEKVSANVTIKDILLQPVAGTVDTPQGIVKDGAGTLVIDESLALTNTIVVREGELTMTGATITNTNHDNVSLSVGGNNATLTMINSTYSRTITGGSGHSSCIALGSGDGKATVSMDGSSMHTDHVVFIGSKNRTYAGVPVHVLPTYADTTGDALYDSSAYHGQSDITLNNGSSMTAGTQFYIDNAKVTLDGGSTMEDQTRGVNPQYASMIGSTDNAQAELHIKGGSKATFNHGIQTGTGENANVVLQVEGAGSELTLKDGTYGSYLGLGSYNYTAGEYEDNGSTTTLNIIEGGKADIESMLFGYAAAAEMTVDSSSSASVKNFDLCASGRVDNAGTIESENLTIFGGTFTNSGSLTTTDLTVKDGGTFEITGNKASVDIEKLILEPGSKFVVNAEISNENTTTPVVGGKISKVFMKGEDKEMEGTMTLNFIPTENLKPGVYSMFEYIADPGLENMTVTGLDGVNYKITIDGETIVITLADQLIVKMDPLADAVQAANWGVFQASQAFTGILWAPRTNALILTPTDSLHSTGYNVAWAAAYSQFTEMSGSNRYSDHDYSIYGMAVGAEHRFTSGRIIGAALGYDQGKAYPTGVNNVDQTSLRAAAYGCAGLWYIGSMGTVSADWSVAVGTTESEHKLSAADWEQDSLQLDVRATYIHKLDSSTYVNGFVGMQYYAQDGARTSRIHADSMQNLRMMLGGGISHIMGKTTLFSELAIYNDVMRHNPSVEVDGFRYGSGANPGRFGGSFSVGAEYMLTPKWSARCSYNYECAADYKQHSLNFGAVYTF